MNFRSLGVANFVLFVYKYLTAVRQDEEKEEGGECGEGVVFLSIFFIGLPYFYFLSSTVFIYLLNSLLSQEVDEDVVVT